MRQDCIERDCNFVTAKAAEEPEISRIWQAAVGLYPSVDEPARARVLPPAILR
jgi:hypothetical protein